MSDVFERVKKILIEQLDADEEIISPEAGFIEDLGADSIDSVELVMTFEVEFDIEIPEDDAAKFIKVKDVVEYIQNRMSRK